MMSWGVSVDVGGKEDRGVLRGRIEDGGDAVFTRVLFENIHHLAANAIDDFTLGSVEVFLQLILLALELLGETSALTGEANFLLIAESILAGAQALTKIVDLFI